MNKLFITSCLILIANISMHAQVSSDYAVLLSAETSVAPPTITLNWPAYADASQYEVFRKAADDVSWGTPIAILAGDATAYDDTDVIIDSMYEYKVKRTNISGLEGEGYLLGAITLHAVDYRGTCLLVMDTTVTDALTNEITRLMDDISGDGWSVSQLHVARDMSPIAVREAIIAAAEADPEMQSVILIGRVPVLYSGNLYPDGHPDHQGAWPADGIYGDINADYTDVTINTTTAGRPENWNTPGDGKYDQSIFKSKLELAVGRIDMYNMPSFALDETGLLKRYLDNDHNFRTGITHFEQRALIDDNFGAFAGEAFASSGWRSYAPLVGNDNLQELDYFSTMYDNSYICSYGCGGGWFQGAGGVGSTTDFTLDTVKTVFTFLFGSYFGDWDVNDSFLRAPLAGGYALTNAWAGRPHWSLHYMGLGYPIGYASRQTQNNQSTYTSNIFPKWVHIALMGDPTLRMQVIAPVSEMHCEISDIQNAIDIHFTASADPEVIGYYVYRAATTYGKYERISDDIVATSPYTDLTPIDGLNYYQVRPVMLTTTPSGTFYNTGIGLRDSISIDVTDVNTLAPSIVHLYPSPADTYIVVVTSSDLVGSTFIIYDISGKAVLTVKLLSEDTSIKTTTLPDGVYTLKFSNGITRQFVVSH